MNALRKKEWSPYTIGILIGVLSWFAFLTANHLLGITTSFEYTAALIAQWVNPSINQTNSYFQQPDNDPKITWEWMLVAGVFFGAFISSRLSGDRTKEKIPELWRARFGNSVSKRFAGAFFGGAIMMFGARLAQGCTSGHGISGLLQLAVSSWIFVATFFIVGVPTAYLVFGKKVAAQVYGGIQHSQGAHHV